MKSQLGLGNGLVLLALSHSWTNITQLSDAIGHHRSHWVKLPVHNLLGFPKAINTLRPRQNGHHSADDIFKFIFLSEIQFSYLTKFIPKVPINPALVQMMAWCREGDKPLFEPTRA